LGEFVDLFSTKKFFYYGVDPQNEKSKYIQTLAGRNARFKAVSKDIQRIKHYVDGNDNFTEEQMKLFPEDKRGMYMVIPKCNFDVEMAVDAMRFKDDYDTIALFSSDSDFSYLISFLRQKGKKIILFHSGPTSKELKKHAHLKINGQRIKEKISFVK